MKYHQIYKIYQLNHTFLEISLLDLCAEIQEIIFSYLNGQDIKNLLLTCTNLNENLSTSSNLMKKLSFIINEQETDVFSIRKYSKIQFYESSEEKMVQVLSIYGNHIRSISINSSLEISVTTIAKITNLCPNLQKIKLNNFHRYLKADVNYTLLKIPKTTTSATFTDYDWVCFFLKFKMILFLFFFFQLNLEIAHIFFRQNYKCWD